MGNTGKVLIVSLLSILAFSTLLGGTYLAYGRYNELRSSDEQAVNSDKEATRADVKKDDAKSDVEVKKSDVEVKDNKLAQSLEDAGLVISELEVSEYYTFKYSEAEWNLIRISNVKLEESYQYNTELDISLMEWAIISHTANQCFVAEPADVENMSNQNLNMFSLYKEVGVCPVLASDDNLMKAWAIDGGEDVYLFFNADATTETLDVNEIMEVFATLN